MNYREFREASAKANLCRVTYEVGKDEAKAVILWWEQSNAKWYAPDPFEGRREVGYTNELWIESLASNQRILSIQILSHYL